MNPTANWLKLLYALLALSLLLAFLLGWWLGVILTATAAIGLTVVLFPWEILIGVGLRRKSKSHSK
jgi:FtsH-binding integral membrane protein